MNFTPLKLPKPHFSWSQLTLWEKNPREYQNQYFLGRKGFSNTAMQYGSKFADALENGTETDDEIMNMIIHRIPKYTISEYNLKGNLVTETGIIPLLGKADTAYDPPSQGIREYKTGKHPWTQRKVDNHGQLTFYATIVYLSEGKLIEQMHLDWIPTDGHRFTGEIQSFETERVIGDIMEMVMRIKRATAQINSAYINFLRNHPI